MSTEPEALRLAQALNNRQECEDDAADCIRRLVAENEALKTVMLAAAEEIQAHWDAHCDAEGYGPANLMRRLEQGIPAEYGYTAGAFAKLTAQRADDEKLLQAAMDALELRCGTNAAERAPGGALSNIRKRLGV